MTTLGEIGILLDQRGSEGFVGRDRERAILAELSAPDGSILLVHLHGIAGVGKSELVQVAVADGRAHGTTVVRLDCRAIEPTERGFLHELSTALGGPPIGMADVAARLSEAGGRGPLALDTDA